MIADTRWQHEGYPRAQEVSIQTPSADQQWQWTVNFKRIYPFFGACPTEEEAVKAARKRVHAMTMHQHLVED